VSAETGELDELLKAFAEDDAAHADVLARVEERATPPPLGLDTPPEPLTLEDALRRFRLDERAARRLALDPGFVGELEVFASALLTKVDPALRSSFPTVNSFLETAGAALPGGGVVVHLLLTLAEGPLLSLLEGWLQKRAREVQVIQKELADEELSG
jgi:hypothetical protein